MNFLTPPRLRVVSALSSNTAIAWFAAAFVASTQADLLLRIGLGIVFVYAALESEESLEK